MKRTWVWIALIGVLMVGTVLATGRSNTEAGPQGTLALRRFLGRMGLAVRDADSPPPGPGVFFLLTDLRSSQQAGELMGWVQQGGTLVEADPHSALATTGSVAAAARVGHYSFGPAKLSPRCVTPESLGVRSLAVDPADQVLSTDDPGSIGCFPESGGFFELTGPLGRGRLVLLGGRSVFTNALLAQASNATFALGLLGTTGTPSGGPVHTVYFGSALPPGPAPTGGVWSTLPLVAKVVLIQLLVALVVFALVRGRRFGRPTLEQLPSPVPAGELVDAVGRLYRASQARAFAGQTMRRATLGRLATRLGARGAGGVNRAGEVNRTGGPEQDLEDAEAVSSSVAQLTGRSLETVRAVLAGPDPADDAALIALGSDLEELRRQVEASWS